VAEGLLCDALLVAPTPRRYTHAHTHTHTLTHTHHTSHAYTLSRFASAALKGDDYILHCHPEEQKVPRADRLRDWYLGMLETAQRRGIVEKVGCVAHGPPPVFNL
jgi:hypothetical protein